MRISDWSSDVCSSDLPLSHTCLYGTAARRPPTGMGSDRFEYRDRDPGDGNAHGGGGPMGRYEEMHGRSLADPEGFWGEAAMAIEWHRRWDSVLEIGRAHV